MQKVLAISGSLRKGNTEWLLKMVLKETRKYRAKTHLVLLRKKEIRLCDGCLICEEVRKCHINDNMQAIYPKLLESDVVILGTPVYFDNVTGIMKNFIDRLNPICEELKGKKLVAVTVGQLKGREGIESRNTVIKYLKNISQIFKMKYVGAISANGREPEEVSKKKSIQRECSRLGKKIAQKN